MRRIYSKLFFAILIATDFLISYQSKSLQGFSCRQDDLSGLPYLAMKVSLIERRFSLRHYCRRSPYKLTKATLGPPVVTAIFYLLVCFG